MSLNTPVQLPFALDLAVYAALTAVCLGALAVVVRGSRGRRFAAAGGGSRWTTQDVLVVAIFGVLLEVYDNLLGDQLIRPLVEAVPFAHDFAANDLPYMFLLVTGIAIVRKPGAATAMVFLNFLLMQVLYGGSESTPLYWPYGLLQGVFIDLYLLARGPGVFGRGGARAVVDGLVIGALRAFPATLAQSAVITPLLSGTTRTLGSILIYTLFNLIGNSIEAGVSAPLALRVARALNPGAGAESRGRGAVDARPAAAGVHDGGDR